MATTQLDDSHVSWEMASSMNLISGNPTEMNHLPPNGNAPTVLYDQLSKKEVFEESDRPMKRLRTRARSASQFATVLPLDEQVTPRMAKNLTTEETHETNGTLGDSSASGSGSTPADSSSTSLMSSFDNGKSTTPRTTPEQNASSPAYTPGFSILHSGKVDPAKCKPRSSLPRLPPAVYGYQCVTSAYASRLDPYRLHPKEQELLQNDLCHLHVTTYLNLRNSILRLWTTNAMVSVTREEALGCAKDYRWMNLASFAYDWLVRYGYINFGCVEVPVPPVTPRKGRRKEGPVIAVIGAGVGGLGCARQLEGLLTHYRDSETSPRVVVIEGRRRIGGRIYSHPLNSMKSDTLPEGLVPKAEMGAQIITGFDRGNPLDQIVRAQLALHYHHIHDMSTLYDIDGTPVNEQRDMRDQRIYNDVLNRSEAYRQKLLVHTTAEGDRESIDRGRDVTGDDGLTIKQYEEALRTGTTHLLVPTKKVRRRRGAGHKSLEDSDLASGNIDEEDPAAMSAVASGWKLRRGVKRKATINLDEIAAVPKQTLGAVLDDGINQYQRMLKMTSKDMRLFNWHYANLEYANAANVDRLSLSGWDQDTGNEFEGEHAQVIGGYQQLPYGLYSLPTKLDVRTNKIVQSISYDSTGTGNKKSVIRCEDGETFEADHIVFTGSLGVLKHRSIEFNPPLPDWKTEAIDRLGFGVMNKLVLVFNEAFWDTERDMFGLLRDSTIPHSMNQEDYAQNRGRFYLFWNCIQSTGLPVLIGLMAGDAAFQAEKSTDKEIIDEAVSQLRNIFKHTRVPDPLETIVTRWAGDKFTYGTYSYVAADALPADYDLMAKPIGNLHFAGEATCGTHPATVHGAYISGLRAAAEVIESITGPMEVLLPLVLEKAPVNSRARPASPLATKSRPRRASATKPVPLGIKLTQSRKRPGPRPRQPAAPAVAPAPPTPPPAPPIDKHRRTSYEKAMQQAITSQIGSPPSRPQRLAPNPFLLYQKDFWSICRDKCDTNRRSSSNNPNAKATRNEIRQALGQMWRNAPADEKQPYLAEIERFRAENAKNEGVWKVQLDEWSRLSVSVKERWCAENPFEGWEAPVVEAESLLAL